MTGLVVRELLPEAREAAPPRVVATALGLSFAAFLAVQVALLGT